MKFLAFALFVCAASAASIDLAKPLYESGKYYEPKVIRQPFKYVTSTPVYEPFKFVGKAAYEPFKVVEAPVVEAKSVDAKVVDAPPVVKPVESIPVVAPVPVVGPKSAFSSGRYESVPVQKYYKNENIYKYDNEAAAPIVRSESVVEPVGYNYLYETANGIAAQATGELKRVDDADVLITRGFYQYTAPDGTPVRVEYEADENGFRPRSDLLPVGPETPEAIRRSLEFIAANPPKAEYIV